jgi:hypothetical protein
MKFWVNRVHSLSVYLSTNAGNSPKLTEITGDLVLAGVDTLLHRP